jgi:DNA relaxase NicK
MEQTFTMTLTKKQAEWVIAQENKERLLEDTQQDLEGLRWRYKCLEGAIVDIANKINYTYGEEAHLKKEEGVKYGRIMYSGNNNNEYVIGYIDLDDLVEMITKCSKTE